MVENNEIYKRIKPICTWTDVPLRFSTILYWSRNCSNEKRKNESSIDFCILKSWYILVYAVKATTQENKPNAPTAAKHSRQPRVPPSAPRLPAKALILAPISRAAGLNLLLDP